MSEFITSRELAHLLHMTENNVYKMRLHKKGPNYIKIGGKILYNMIDVNNYIASCYVDINNKK